MVALADRPIADALIILKLHSIFGDRLHIKPDTKVCCVCGQDLPVGRFKPGERITDGLDRCCSRCSHIVAITRIG